LRYKCAVMIPQAHGVRPALLVPVGVVLCLFVAATPAADDLDTFIQSQISQAHINVLAGVETGQGVVVMINANDNSRVLSRIAEFVGRKYRWP
jgi:hypothetical protein